MTAIHTRKKIKNRLELDKRLRGEGQQAPLFKNDEARDKAAWVLKKKRLGEDHKTVNWEP